MATEKTLEILKELKADPKAKELLKSLEKPNLPEEMVSAIAKIAEETGYNITAEDIREALEQEEARRKEKTDNAVADMVGLDDADLENVAGGVVHWFDLGMYKEGCRNDFTDISCIFNDACDWFIQEYYGCDDVYHSEYNAPCSKESWDKHDCNRTVEV